MRHIKELEFTKADHHKQDNDYHYGTSQNCHIRCKSFLLYAWIIRKAS